MTLVPWLLITPLIGIGLTALLSPLSRKHAAPVKMAAILGFSVLLVLAILSRKEIGSTPFAMNIAGWTLTFAITEFSWYFIIMITGISWLTAFFSIGALRDGQTYPTYYPWLFSKVFGMVGVVLAHDLLSFFILWEMMSWATYALMQQGGDKAKKAAFSYLIYAVSASLILFVGVLVLWKAAGGFDFAAVSAAVASFDNLALIGVMILVLIPMLIEAAAYPAHWWLPASYASSETGITAFLAGISTRIGIYGIVLFLFSIFGLSVVNRLSVGYYLNLRVILMVFGAMTMVFPTFTALFQHDAKRLMTWHSIGQGGYMIVGLATASTLGVAGGLFHIFNHMAYVSLILFSIAAVEYRTGTTDLNSLGGLIKKQPVAFLGLLFGIIGLAGIPPMNGFVSKWLIYRSLILSNHPFLALSAFIATLGTILSVYKLIHNIFLGQLPERYEHVKEVGPWMQIPIMILMAVVMATGVFPGTILAWVARIQSSFGLEPIAYTLSGVAAEAGDLNMNVVTIVFMGGVIAAGGLFFLGGKRKRVSQYDNYAAGHVLDKNVKYNFTYNFYSSFDHIAGDLYRKAPIRRTESGLTGLIGALSDFIRRLYTGQLNTYLAYSLTAVLLVVIILKEAL